MLNRWRVSLARRLLRGQKGTPTHSEFLSEDASPFPAQDAVLSTPELLELVLLCLPLRDLLVTAPRVCKTWNAVTLTPTLQRALFFQPDPYSSTAPPTRNALLMTAFPRFFASDEPSGPQDILRMPWAQAPEAFRRRDASWRRMLVAQPPVRTLVVTNGYHTPGGTFERHGRKDCGKEDGLRMGLLYDFVLPRVDHLGTWFVVRWPGCNGVAGGEELALELVDMAHGTPYKSPLNKRFYSKARGPTYITFSEYISS